MSKSDPPERRSYRVAWHAKDSSLCGLYYFLAVSPDSAAREAKEKVKRERGLDIVIDDCAIEEWRGFFR